MLEESVEFVYFRRMILEICANSFESAQAAQSGGAHRIELCGELALGGITPSHGLLEKVIAALSIPVFVLIRPRSGDFCYSDDEMDVMLRDIAFAKAIGVQGIVSGVLHPNHEIDRERTGQLVSASKGMAFTFHRAFDWTPDAIESIDILIELGIERVLTSGQKPSAGAGLEILNKLRVHANGQLGILPGGGIHAGNVKTFKAAGFKEVHASASSFRKLAALRIDPSVLQSVPMHNTRTLDQHEVGFSDVEKIKALLKAVQ
ncbi:MAG: copper homeostasis protein [Flavobacteriales bacterium]|jgi:copper homeostasis protein